MMLFWMMLVVLARARVTRRGPVRGAYLGGITWAIAGMVALNTVGNIASQSAFEQQVFAPITAVLTALSVVIAHRSGQT